MSQILLDCVFFFCQFCGICLKLPRSTAAVAYFKCFYAVSLVFKVET